MSVNQETTLYQLVQENVETFFGQVEAETGAGLPERLQRNRAGDVVLQLKSPYQDGTTHIVMIPLEFVQRLATLVPRPRLNLIQWWYGLLPSQHLR